MWWTSWQNNHKTLIYLLTLLHPILLAIFYTLNFFFPLSSRGFCIKKNLVFLLPSSTNLLEIFISSIFLHQLKSYENVFWLLIYSPLSYCVPLYLSSLSPATSSFNFFLPLKSSLLQLFNWAIEDLVVCLKRWTGLACLPLPCQLHSLSIISSQVL